ncbi:MAG TPA: hypothetical protein VLB46_20410 [Pyrinomonadaceae bacterium]|nr:hypothetical protein [Pyrinomonadaceae bacterium]
MLLSFVDKLGSVFDRRFIHAYWLPSFVFVVLLIALGVAIYGIAPSLNWWNNVSASASVVCSVALLFLITVLAILIQPFAVPLTRFYLGYWPESLSYFTDRGKARERQRFTVVEVSKERLRPTKLGNVLASAYEYPDRLYQLDPAIWLPRLTPLLPENFRAQMDNALTPVFCLLNLSTFFSALAIVGGLLIVVFDQRWWFFLLVWTASLLLARACYRASVSQCAEYASLIRVAFDLYRSELLKQLRISLPPTPEKEYPLWKRLERWIHFDKELPERPWRDLLDGETPLCYDNYKDPAAAVANTVNVSVATPIQLRIETDE